MIRFSLSLSIALTATAANAQERVTPEQKVRADRARVTAEDVWIYNDLPQAFTVAKTTGKPILVVMRCIPCEQCVKLDDELMDRDPTIRPLLEKFVCVRQVSTNGLDLSLFQFDTDQSFAVFMLNADGTIYGRFGTRSHRTEWLGDVSLSGLAKALQAALDLHADYPANQASLVGKRGAALEFATPEQFPMLKEKYSDRLDYEGHIARSCIHCHQIGDARRDHYRRAQAPIPEKLLFPSPHPQAIGLIFDPREIATVTSVTSGSPAEHSGFRAGDRLVRLDGQALISIADVQWVLDGCDPQGGQIPADVDRDGASVRLSLTLNPGWRRQDNLSWRASSWGLRRMTTGGMLLGALSPSERAELNIPESTMALAVQHVGQYGPHAAAKKAGFQKGDVIVELDGHRDLMRETDVLMHGVTDRRPGDEISVTLLRNGKTLSLMLPMQL